MNDRITFIFSSEVVFDFPYYNGVDLWPIITITLFGLIIFVFLLVSCFLLKKSAKVRDWFIKSWDHFTKFEDIYH